MIVESVRDYRPTHEPSLKNFKLIKNDLNMKPLLDAINSHPGLWDDIKERQTTNGSPHKYTKSIFVRWCQTLDVHSCFNDLKTVDYIARKKLFEVNKLINEVTPNPKILGRVLIVNLAPGGFITPHIDEGLVASLHDRFHIPLISELGNEFHCEDESIHMKPGELWWFDNKKTHWLKNNSNVDRIHLIIDRRISGH